MEISGVIQNGVVVFDGRVPLPDGTVVVVTTQTAPVVHVADQPVAALLPIFPSDQPGAIDLTNDRIAEILDQEDASS